MYIRFLLLPSGWRKDRKPKWGSWDWWLRGTGLMSFTTLLSCSLSLSLVWNVWLWPNRMAMTYRQSRRALQSNGTLGMAIVASRTHPVFTKTTTPCHFWHGLLFVSVAKWLRGAGHGVAECLGNEYTVPHTNSAIILHLERLEGEIKNSNSIK